jgi:hypothetical protein
MNTILTEEQVKAYGIDTDICGDWLYLVSGGNVIYRRWCGPDYDENDNLISDSYQEYGLVDADNLWRYLFEYVKLAPGVKVVDVFKFVLSQPALHPIIGSYCKEYCEDGVNNLIPAEKLREEDTSSYPLEYMEVYRIAEIGDDIEYRYSDDDYEKKAAKQRMHDRFPDFHGVAYPLEENCPETGMEKGYRVNCDIGLLEARKYADLPLVLNEDYTLYDMDQVEYNKVIEATKGYTLIEMLKGMFWDMTWYGNVYAGAKDKFDRV